MADRAPVPGPSSPTVAGSPPPRPTGKTPAILAACIGLAVVCASPLTESSEGYSSKVYLDPAKIPTYCFGETEGVDRARLYSKSECAVLLRKRMARDYAPKIAACVPEIVDDRRVKVFGALLDASYNAGPAAVCRSPMRTRIRAGQWRQGCEAFRGWYVTARDRRTGQRFRLKGLVLRRDKEAALCLEGLKP